jgi:ATP-dependent Clp protease ATP-binding subunit ClpX
MSKRVLEQTCNFCSRSENEVDLMITGPEANICDSCTVNAYHIVQEQLEDERVTNKKRPKSGKTIGGIIKSPRQIKEHLDQYVIGQDRAKRVLSVAVYNHFKRLNAPKSKAEDQPEIEKSNVLFVGRTGTGKTLMARTIAKLLDVPFAIVDATVFTEAGYVGEDIESILSRLLQNCDYNVEAAERGIVFIDEIDKIARKNDSPSITRDVSGEGVQQGLLKLLEGADINVPPYGGRKHPEQKMITVNTTNILFICGGAFDGIEKTIARRVNSQVIGYGRDDNAPKEEEQLLRYISAQDVKSFGLIPELVGRIPVIVHLEPLDEEALMRILSEPKNALMRQYKHLFSLEGVSLVFTEEAQRMVARKAIEFKLGARGLRSIMEAILIDLMYDMPPTDNKKEILIDGDYVTAQLAKSKINFETAA